MNQQAELEDNYPQGFHQCNKVLSEERKTYKNFPLGVKCLCNLHVVVPGALGIHKINFFF